jgi:hypothetical protein
MIRVAQSLSMSLTLLRSLLGLDGLYDPPRLMTSEATLDLPTPYSATASAEPQQAVTAAQNAATPTADSHTGAPNGPGPDEGGSPSDASTKASALMETTDETTGPLSDSPAAMETGMAGGGDGDSPSHSDEINPQNNPSAPMETGMTGGGGGGSRSQSDGTNPPNDPTDPMETGVAGGEDGGSQSNIDATNPPSKPTAAMETQSPQLTTPSGDPTATDGGASSHSDQSQLSGISSSNSAEDVSAKTSSACYNVFPADLYSLVFSCLVLICLVW